ncbi:general alpha-glucoside permease [Zalerion maritima]|uniref:General alpha-glucoside permease n=1 Tax=Zalerion maritima TaxID=339359 RepID=A0AAD5WX69_9PEZI|nr:general alpha-glucoside permease [Zalerion maritima]
MTNATAPSPERRRPVLKKRVQSPPAESSKEPTGSAPRNSSTERDEQEDGINEHSPLLSPSGSEIGRQIVHEQEEHQATKSIWYLILLTISIGGLQIAWSVELSNGSPYLLSLGISKSLMALVWIAGPLSGTIVQPYVGMLSDNCRLRWGKRKPFMVGGTAATVVSLLFLAYTKEVVHAFLGLFGANLESYAVQVCVIVVAVVWVYVLDFSINTVQAAIRAFIVDCAPSHQQEAANAMASRVVGVGNIIGYLAGYVDLPLYIGFLGKSQFKVLCAIASISLTVTVLLSVGCIRERDPRLEGPPPTDKPGVSYFFVKIFTNIKKLPPQIKKVCQVQFCAWIGFFPMLFYTSSYIGEIYVEPFLEENPNMTDKELDKLYEEATRVGTFALLIFAITSLATNVLLPFLIAPTYDNAAVPDMGQYDDEDEESKKKSWVEHLIVPGFTLRRAWMLSQLIFSAAMFCTVLVRTVTAATVLIGLVGITWALTLWAPWAIISAEIARRDAIWRARKAKQAALAEAVANNRDDFDSDSSDDEGSFVIGPPSPQPPPEEDDKEDEDEEPAQAGIILGIHNMAIAAPQIIATFASSIIFKLFQKPRGTPGDHSIAIVLALGGTTVLASAWLIHLIKEDTELPPDVLSAMEDGDLGPSDSVYSFPCTPVGSCPPSPLLSRRPSFSISRQSMDRATLIRNNSFGGLEY